MKPSTLNAITAGLGGGVLLLIEHYIFQRGENRLEPPITYVLGTATIGGALTWWAQREQKMEAATAFWLIAGLGGAVVTGAYVLDELQNQS